MIGGFCARQRVDGQRMRQHKLAGKQALTSNHELESSSLSLSLSMKLDFCAAAGAFLTE